MNQFTNVLTRSALGLAAAALCSTALADTVSTTMPVTATVGADCTVEAGALDFGSYDYQTIQAQSTITVTCGSNTAYNVAIDGGQVPQNGFRHMSNANPDGGTVGYCISNTNSADPCDGQWGDTGFGDTFPFGGPVVGVGTGEGQSLDVFAKTGFYNSATSGTFSDLVTVTVHF